MKVTKKHIKEFLSRKLSTDKVWAIQAMNRIYEYQTTIEQTRRETIDRNYVGFNGADGSIMTSIHDFLITNGYISPKQLAIVFARMPKYWNHKLKSMITGD